MPGSVISEQISNERIAWLLTKCWGRECIPVNLNIDSLVIPHDDLVCSECIDFAVFSKSGKTATAKLDMCLITLDILK